MADFFDQLDSPNFLSTLSADDLVQLAAQIRSFLLETLDETGGHLASNLGVVELTMAMHVVFDTPIDKLVWDVGHQTYVHKILTGRKDELKKLRQVGGTSGFLKRNGNPYDCFGAGHSSTSISAALGMDVAQSLLGISGQVACIIGDGAIAAGLCFEAMNHAGFVDNDITIVLNDNKMSISENVGALNNHLTTFLTEEHMQFFKRRSQEFLLQFPRAHDLVRLGKAQIKQLNAPQSNFFQSLNLHYYGPVDGHDLPNLIKVLRNIRRIKGPKILHVLTQKGAGFLPAEQDPIKFHGVKKNFLAAQPASPSSQTPAAISFSQVLGAWVCKQASVDKTLCVITPAMKEGSCLDQFSTQFANRFFDVGIAEQHSVTFAAGLAAAGARPLLAIYSTFLQRAYDQLIHDVILQKLPLILAIDRAGVVGEDGETHSGAYDIGFLRILPNIVIATPKDGASFYRMLNSAKAYKGCFAIRFPKDNANMDVLEDSKECIAIGSAQMLFEGTSKIAVLNFGPLLLRFEHWFKAQEISMVDMRFVKPLDEKMLHHVFQSYQFLIVIEDHVFEGGACSAVLEWANQQGYCATVIRSVHLPVSPIPAGQRNKVLDKIGLNLPYIQSIVREFLSPQ